MRERDEGWPEPTGTAFDDALDYLQVLEQRGVSLLELERLVWVMHGICLNPVNHEPFAHAWVHLLARPSVVLATPHELGAAFFEAPRAWFDEVFRPQLVTRYTVGEVLKLNWHHENYGPWLPEYVALCTPR